MIQYVILAALAAQQPPPAAPADPEKLCKVEGKAVHSVTAEPLRKVRLTLMSLEGGARQAYAGATDAEGKFTLPKVEPGRYRLSAEKVGFVRQSYGSTGVAQMGTTLNLQPRQEMRDIVFKMIPQGVIIGRVLDEEGDPMPTVQIMVTSARTQGGRRQQMPAGSGMSNDIGEYRVAGLSPGRYFLSAVARQREGMMPAVVTVTSTAESDEGYGTVYFPGTHDPAGATPIQIAAGAELRGVDLRLMKRRVVRIRGRVEGVGRRPAMVMLQPRRMDWFGFDRNMNSTRPDGQFEIRGVTPGSYVLTVNVMEENERGWARMPVEVGEANIDNIVLTIQSSFQVAGRLRIEGDASAVRMASVRVMLQMPAGAAMFGPGGGMGTVKEDGTFTLTNVTAEQYTIVASGLPGEAFLKSARWGEQDVLDTGLDLSSGAAGGTLDLVYSLKGGQIDGTALNAKQEPARGVSVTLAPDARRQNQTQLYKMTSTDQNGMFNFRGLAPGDYRLFAWEEVDPMGYRDPEYLKPFESKAKAVTIREGGRETAEVKVIPSETEKQ